MYYYFGEASDLWYNQPIERHLAGLLLRYQRFPEFGSILFTVGKIGRPETSRVHWWFMLADEPLKFYGPSLLQIDSIQSPRPTKLRGARVPSHSHHSLTAAMGVGSSGGE